MEKSRSQIEKLKKGKPVNEENLKSLSTPEEKLAAARSRAHMLFVQAFAYPASEQWDALHEGDLVTAMRTVLSEIDAGLLEGVSLDALRETGEDRDTIAVEYTRLFDVGGSGGPSCSLWGGTYSDARMKMMEEAVRFYNHFGLSVSEDPHELPDHITTQLEFLHYLTYRETEALQAGEDAGSYRRAQRDFVLRHPGKWVPKLAAAVKEQKAMEFFVVLTELLRRFLQHETEHLIRLEGPPSLTQGGGAAAPSASVN